MFIVHVHCSLFMFIVHCSHGATLIFDDVFQLHMSIILIVDCWRGNKVSLEGWSGSEADLEKNSQVAFPVLTHPPSMSEAAQENLAKICWILRGMLIS